MPGPGTWTYVSVFQRCKQQMRSLWFSGRNYWRCHYRWFSYYWLLAQFTEMPIRNAWKRCCTAFFFQMVERIKEWSLMIRLLLKNMYCCVRWSWEANNHQPVKRWYDNFYEEPNWSPQDSANYEHFPEASGLKMNLNKCELLPVHLRFKRGL